MNNTTFINSCFLGVFAFSSLLEARSYQVEVTIFSNRPERIAGVEVWPDIEIIPNFGNAAGLRGPEEIVMPEELDSERLKYLALPKELRNLNLESKFENNQKLQLLLSEGWNQGKPEDDVFEYVYIHSDPIPAFSAENGLSFQDMAVLSRSFTLATVKKIQGVVGIKVSQLLFVDLDFIFSAEEGLVRLKESRKIKLKELNYFDHPLFGVLLMVSPVESSEEDS